MHMSDPSTTSLHHIASLPFDRSAPVLAAYPGLKLGVARSVRHYADRLTPPVRAITDTGPDAGRWVVTAPPVAADTPAAANLLCWELHRQSAGGTAMTLVDILLGDPPGARMDWKDPGKPLDYARLDFADRVRERDRFSRHLVEHTAFRGRPVLFVNDICVTGAQQRSMERYFRRVGARRVHWLYVVTVEPAVGRSNPTIEWEINFVPFRELVRLLTREEIAFTGKCVQRLMHLTERELAAVLDALSQERRVRLLELAVLNGFGELDAFAANFDLLRAYAGPSARHAGVQAR